MSRNSVLAVLFILCFSPFVVPSQLTLGSVSPMGKALKKSPFKNVVVRYANL